MKTLTLFPLLCILAGAEGDAGAAPASVSPPAGEVSSTPAPRREDIPGSAEDKQARLQVSASLRTAEADHPEILSDAQAGMQTGLRISIAFFFSLVALVAGALLYRSRKDQFLHETLRQMLEKGVPFPDGLLPRHHPRSDLRRGMLLLAGGIGLGAFLGLEPDVPSRVWTLCLIPILIGGAYLLVWRLEERRGRR